MSSKRKTNKRKILVDLIVLALGQKKKNFEKKEPAKKKVKEAKEIHVNLWQHKDIQNADDLCRWTFQNMFEICMTSLPPYLTFL